MVLSALVLISLDFVLSNHGLGGREGMATSQSSVTISVSLTFYLQCPPCSPQSNQVDNKYLMKNKCLILHFSS